MIIEITDRVLNNQQWHPLLDVIMEYIENPSFRLSFELSTAQKLPRSAWLRNATGSRATYAALIRSSMKAMARRLESNLVRVVLDDTAPRSGELLPHSIIKIHPVGGLILIAFPFHLIVEDESSDGGFVLWMARLTNRSEILDAYRAGRLIFRHAGGKGQVPKSAKVLTYGVWAREDKPILTMTARCGAMLDSDSRHPTDSPNDGIVEQTRPHVSFVHVLSARTIENYVTKKYFKRRLCDDGCDAMVDAYFKLSLEQRNHFPAKQGFRSNMTPFRALTHTEFLADTGRCAAQRALYQDVDPAVWNVIAPGFGDRLAKVYMESSYRCDARDARELPAAHRGEIDKLLILLIRHL